MQFAGDKQGRFVVDGTWRLDHHGLPELLGASSRLVTRVVDLVSAGDSYIAVAEVEAASLRHPLPLVNHAATFHSLPAGPLPHSTSPTTPEIGA